MFDRARSIPPWGAAWLAAAVASLLALGGALAVASRDTGALVRERAEARARFAAIPDAEFRRDRANRLAGTAVDAQGEPLAGVDVLALDAGALAHALASAPPGEWPEPPSAERVARTDERGRYEL